MRENDQHRDGITPNPATSHRPTTGAHAPQGVTLGDDWTCGPCHAQQCNNAGTGKHPEERHKAAALHMGIGADMQYRNVMSEKKVTVTSALIEQGKTRRGGWKMAQLAIIGVPWPPLPGWRQRSEGTIITREEATRFIALGRDERTHDPSEPKLTKTERAAWLAQRQRSICPCGCGHPLNTRIQQPITNPKRP